MTDKDDFVPINRAALEKLVAARTPFSMPAFEKLLAWDFRGDAPASRKELAWEILNLPAKDLKIIEDWARACPQTYITSVKKLEDTQESS